MKEFLSKYKTEVLVGIAILVVMFAPYIIINSGWIQSESALLEFDTLTKFLTPLVIGALCAVIVYRAIKKNREDR